VLEACGAGRWCQRLEAPARGAKGFSRTTIIFSPGRGVHTRDGDGRVTSTVKHAERAIERRSGPRGGCAASDGRGRPRDNCGGGGQLVHRDGSAESRSEPGRDHHDATRGVSTLLLAPASAWRTVTQPQRAGGIRLPGVVIIARA